MAAPAGAARRGRRSTARLSSASDVDVLGEGEHAQAGRAGVLLEEGAAVVEQRPVAAELVDQEAAEQPPLVRREQRHRAGHRRDHPAALDVRDQHPRRAEAGDEPEVHQIVRAQVQLADAAGAFDHDHVEAARQIGVGGEDLADQHVEGGVVVARRQRLPHPPVQHDLAGAVAIRLQQDRVHRRLRLQPARLGLRHLRPPDLAAAATRVGMVRHRLRLERRDADAAAVQPCADRGSHPALARVRRRPTDEERPRRHAAIVAGSPRVSIHWCALPCFWSLQCRTPSADRLAPLAVCLALAAPAAAQHTRVTAALGGVPPDGLNGAGVLSADGRFVAFESEASNLVTGDTNDSIDVFVRDLATVTTTRVSVANDGLSARPQRRDVIDIGGRRSARHQRRRPLRGVHVASPARARRRGRSASTWARPATAPTSTCAIASAAPRRGSARRRAAASPTAPATIPG